MHSHYYSLEDVLLWYTFLLILIKELLLMAASFRFLPIVSVVVVHHLLMNAAILSYVMAFPLSIPRVLFCEVLGTSNCAAPLMHRQAGEAVCPVAVLFGGAC